MTLLSTCIYILIPMSHAFHISDLIEQITDFPSLRGRPLMICGEGQRKKNRRPFSKKKKFRRPLSKKIIFDNKIFENNFLNFLTKLVFFHTLVASSVSRRGYRISLVCVSVCVCVLVEATLCTNSTAQSYFVYHRPALCTTELRCAPWCPRGTYFFEKLIILRWCASTRTHSIVFRWFKRYIQIEVHNVVLYQYTLLWGCTM